MWVLRGESSGFAVVALDVDSRGKAREKVRQRQAARSPLEFHTPGVAMEHDLIQDVTVSDVVRNLYAAFLKRDRKTVETLLDEDFTFTSPLDDHISKARYFERCWPNGDQFRSFRILKLFAEGNEAFVLYECEMNNGKRFRNVEFITVTGGRIRAVDVYFGRTLRVDGSTT
jgi:ketosteroid isomerase-like protein